MEVTTTMLPQRVNVRERDTERTSLPMLFKTTIPPRFWSKVYADPSECWLWTGHINAGGYGWFQVRKAKGQSAHIYLYERLVAPHLRSEAGVRMTLDHLCRVRHCVNPRHLERVTHRENVRRGVSVVARNANATHCIHGHEFTAFNTAVRPEGGRHCLACRRRRNAKRYSYDYDHV